VDADALLMLSSLIDFVFPARCIVCNSGPRQLCENCLPQSRVIPIAGFHFPVTAGFELEGGVEKIIAGYKDQQLTSLERPLAQASALLLAAQDFSSIDAIVTPARNSKNYRKRGFDPARNIAKRALKLVGVRVPVISLGNAKTRLDQRGLGKRQRLQNVRGTMSLRRSGLLRVALFDDVMTTGATVFEMARACEQAGVEVAFCCVLAQRKSNI
jgi:predicted amidophosphoribosyltransferase